MTFTKISKIEAKILFQKFVYQFFEALAICHTVQVAGIYNEEEDKDEDEENILKDDSDIPEIFNVDLESSIEEVEEIEDNGSGETLDNVDFMRPKIHRRSISLIQSAVLKNFQATIENRAPIARPVTVMPMNAVDHRKDYNRTNSDIIGSSTKTVTDFKGHRRSQSSIPHPVSGARPVTVNVSRVPTFRRNLILRSSTREFYAAPAFTAASLLERNESIRRRQEIETFIE